MSKNNKDNRSCSCSILSISHARALKYFKSFICLNDNVPFDIHDVCDAICVFVCRCLKTVELMMWFDHDMPEKIMIGIWCHFVGGKLKTFCCCCCFFLKNETEIESFVSEILLHDRLHRFSLLSVQRSSILPTFMRSPLYSSFQFRPLQWIHHQHRHYTHSHIHRHTKNYRENTSLLPLSCALKYCTNYDICVMFLSFLCFVFAFAPYNMSCHWKKNTALYKWACKMMPQNLSTPGRIMENVPCLKNHMTKQKHFCICCFKDTVAYWKDTRYWRKVVQCKY